MKKILLVLLVVVLTGCNIISNSEEEIDMYKCSTSDVVNVNQTVTLEAYDLWTNSVTCENLKYEDGLIRHIDETMDALLETDIYYIDEFLEMVPSWNALISKDSLINFYIAVGNEDGFSHYYSMGLWREKYMVSYGNQEDEYGSVHIDTIVTNLNNIDRFKIKIQISDSDTNETYIKNVSVTTKQNYLTDYDTSFLKEKVIDVTPRQQMSVPDIGGSICSPTSLSMVLNYYGYSDPQDIVALNVFDKGANIYGNWSFNASYPGGFELYSRVEYINDLATLMGYIDNDIPVVLSIKTTDKAQLEGSLMAYPSGHLIVLIGFRQIDGEWYGIVNDPAEYTDEAVPREYKLSQLLEVWRGYSYIVSDESIE